MNVEEKIFGQEIIPAFACHNKTLFLGPFIVELAAIGLSSFLPDKYTSVAYLCLDQATAKPMEALMTSQTLAESVL